MKKKKWKGIVRESRSKGRYGKDIVQRRITVPREAYKELKPETPVIIMKDEKVKKK